MDETKFKSHAEKTFWEKVYVASIEAGWPVSTALANADDAVVARRFRMQGLTKPGVHAA